MGKRTGKTYPSLFLQRQRGAALIAGLILLIVMTVLGLTAMNGATLELMMASNIHYQTTALNNAEKSLAAAEDYILNNITGAGFDFSTDDGCYVLDTSSTINPATHSWSFTSNTAYEGGTDVGNYIVEYAGPRRLPGESAAMGRKVAGANAYFYRVTSRATDARGALRILQSIYATQEGP